MGKMINLQTDLHSREWRWVCDGPGESFQGDALGNLAITRHLTEEARNVRKQDDKRMMSLVWQFPSTNKLNQVKREKRGHELKANDGTVQTAPKRVSLGGKPW